MLRHELRALWAIQGAGLRRGPTDGRGQSGIRSSTQASGARAADEGNNGERDRERLGTAGALGSRTRLRANVEVSIPIDLADPSFSSRLGSEHRKRFRSLADDVDTRDSGRATLPEEMRVR
jgi:hypothetical protein